jgi:hypothetical protein
LSLATPIQALPVVDNYRWNRAASEEALLAILWWWAVLTVLGWSACRRCLAFFVRCGTLVFGSVAPWVWLLGGWLLWLLTSLGLFSNTVAFAWFSLGLVALSGVWGPPPSNARPCPAFVRARWRNLLVGEGVFAAGTVGLCLGSSAKP